MNKTKFIGRFLIIASILFHSCVSKKHTDVLLVGTYSTEGSKGIYKLNFNNNEGTLAFDTSIQSSNPSFLTLSADKKFVYAVNENAGKDGGAVSSYSFNKANGFKFINKVASEGDHPCYISLSHNGQWALVSNYSSGILSLLGVNADGSLTVAKQIIKQNAVMPDSTGDGKPHVHSAVFSKDDSKIFMCDLGTDEILLFPFDKAAGKIIVDEKVVLKQTRGMGPRHLAFPSNTNNFYALGEKNASVVFYKFNNQTNSYLKEQENILVARNNINMGGADIHISPNNKFLYASIRGETNKVFIFEILKNGVLKLQGSEAVDGVGPRNFSIHPSGKFLLVANQRSNNIVVFKINPNTGALKNTGNQISLPSPVSLQWIP